MVSGQLVAAMDFSRRKEMKHEQYSYRQGEQWFVVNRGQTYAQTWQVTSYDEAGLKFLQRIEYKEGIGAEDQTVQP